MPSSGNRILSGLVIFTSCPSACTIFPSAAFISSLCVQLRGHGTKTNHGKIGKGIEMFIAKKCISRRAVLRGVGVGLALPLLDSMVPAQTPLRKTAASPRSRLACIEMVHGAAGSTAEGASKHYWSPQEEGSNFELSYSLEPLAPFREYITIVTGTDARQAEAFAPSEG